jgi:hypothetical protein
MSNALLNIQNSQYSVPLFLSSARGGLDIKSPEKYTNNMLSHVNFDSSYSQFLDVTLQVNEPKYSLFSSLTFQGLFYG